MQEKVDAFLEEEEGLTTAEYAVGTVAVAGLGGVLIKLLTSDWAMDIIKRVIGLVSGKDVCLYPAVGQTTG